MADAQSGEAEIAKVLDDALETLRNARSRVEDRGTSEALRDLETRLGYLAQALSWEMDGESEKAATALRIAQGISRREQDAMERILYEQWWSH